MFCAQANSPYTSDYKRWVTNALCPMLEPRLCVYLTSGQVLGKKSLHDWWCRNQFHPFDKSHGVCVKYDMSVLHKWITNASDWQRPHKTMGQPKLGAEQFADVDEGAEVDRAVHGA